MLIKHKPKCTPTEFQIAIRTWIFRFPKIAHEFDVNTDKEYMAGLRYILTKNFGITTHYDSDMGLGFGLNVNY
jgi:hypothetical protein